METESYAPLQSSVSNMSDQSGPRDYFGGVSYDNDLRRSASSANHSTSSLSQTPAAQIASRKGPLSRSEGPGGSNRRPSAQRSTSSPSLNAKPKRSPSSASRAFDSPSGTPPNYMSSKKPAGHRDVIDQLDFSSMFFSPGVHHDGPFDAASSHRNRADSGRPPPMAAFQDPAGPNYPYQSPTSGSRGGSPSPTAALATGSSTLSVPSIEDEKESLSDKASAHRSVHLGYPAPYLFNDDKSSKHFGDEERREASRAKAAAYAEAFGLQDQEAWEDYGRSHYAKEPPRESVYHLPKSPASRVGLSAAAESSSSLSPSRQIRAERTASVWDMEATLKAGVPVASAPPPVPSIPPAYANSSNGSPSSSSGTPKRSKSLLRMGRSKNKDSPSPSTSRSNATQKPNLVISAPEIIQDNSGSISAPTDLPSDWKQEKYAAMQGVPPPAQQTSLQSSSPKPTRSTSLGHRSRPRPKAPPPVGPSFDDVMLADNDTSRESVTLDMLNDLDLDEDSSDGGGRHRHKGSNSSLSPSNSKSEKLGRSTSLLRRLRGKH